MRLHPITITATYEELGERAADECVNSFEFGRCCADEVELGLKPRAWIDPVIGCICESFEPQFDLDVSERVA